MAGRLAAVHLPRSTKPGPTMNHKYVVPNHKRNVIAYHKVPSQSAISTQMLRAVMHVTEYDEYGNIAAHVENFYSVNDHVTSNPETELKLAHAGIISISNNTIK